MAFGAHPFALVALVLDLFLATLVLQQYVPVLERLSASVAGHIVSTVVIFFVLLKSHLPNRLTTLVTEKIQSLHDTYRVTLKAPYFTHHVVIIFFLS